jgi:chromosome segregation ATPase
MMSAALRPLPARTIGALLAGALLAAGCGRPDGDVVAAQRAAQEAGERASDLEAEVSSLGRSLASARADIDAAATERAELGDRLARALKRLRGSLARVRNAVNEAQDASHAASSSASAAVAEADGVAHDLAVLKNRYDYHLRRYHGGGP